MGHSSRKSNQSAPSPQGFDLNALGQIMNNIDVSAMTNMLNNIDISQIMSMMNNVNGPVPIENNLKEASSKGFEQSSNPETASPVFNTVPIEPIKFNPNPEPVTPQLPPNDPIVMVLNSLKPFLPKDKCKIIDDMITLLGIKVVVDSIFPPKLQK
jgi:hypothetical protein